MPMCPPHVYMARPSTGSRRSVRPLKLKPWHFCARRQMRWPGLVASCCWAMRVAGKVGISCFPPPSKISSAGGGETFMWTYAVGCLVGRGVRSAAMRRFLRAGGEDVIVCACEDGSGIVASVARNLLVFVLTESRLLLASSLRQLRKMLYTAAEDGEGTCCVMSTRSRKAGSWR
jgi:hypothetical protein